MGHAVVNAYLLVLNDLLLWQYSMNIIWSNQTEGD